MTATTHPLIVGGTDEAQRAYRDLSAASAREWRRKAQEARYVGAFERARAFDAVAGIAERVADGRR